MKIRAITAVPFVLPYLKPFHMANGTVTEAAHVLIRVETDEGVTGVAEAVSRPMIYGESQASIVEAVRAWFAPALVGLDPFETEAAQRILRSVVGNETAKGAIDLAMHDLRGIALGQPTWRLLGAASDSLRVTRMLSMGTVGAVVGEATGAREDHGITSFKVKIDADPGESVALLRALRAELGEDATLYVDANQSLTAESALQTFERIRDLGIEFVEEPIPANDVVGRARLAAAGATIMSDESARTVEDAALQLTAGSARALSIKPARTGYTESARVLGLARGLHARTVIGSQGDSAIGTVTSATFGAAFDATAREVAELDYFLGLRDQLTAEPPRIEHGRIAVNTSRPGNGVLIDEQKLDHYRNDA